MGVKGRLKNGELYLAGEINERLPTVTKGLVEHYPFDGTVSRYIDNEIRYIRDWLNGSTANFGSHWVEIQAINKDGVNVALGKSGTSNDGGRWDGLITDGNTNTSPYFGIDRNGVDSYVQVDLGAIVPIEKIKIWHYFGDYRIYLRTKTEVSKDGVNWTTLFDSALEGYYTETPKGRTHYLSGASGVARSNIALTNEYLALAPATTNTANQQLGIYNNHGMPATLTRLNEMYKGQPVYRLAMTPTTESQLATIRTELWSHGVLVANAGYFANTKYASSIFWRPVNKSDIVFGGVASNMGYWIAGENEYFEDGWRRYHRYLDGTMTDNRNDHIHHSFYCPSAKLNETIYIDVCCPQTESGRTYPTEFTIGTRGAGAITIPFKLKPPYTINLRYKSLKALSEMIEQVDSPVILQMNPYHTNASITLWNYKKILSTYTKGDTGTAWSGSYNFFYSFTNDTWNNVEHMYTLLVTNRAVKVYMDGVYLGEQTSTVDITNISDIRLGGSNHYEARYRDLSIYNRLLTDEEIRKLNKKDFKMSPDGDVNGLKIKESLAIPNDALHIPLSGNARSTSKVVNASDETNVVYKDGSAWVGHTASNLINNSISSMQLPDANVKVVAEGYNGISPMFKATKSNTSALIAYSSARFPLSLTIGETVAISFKAKSLSGNTLSRVGVHVDGGNQVSGKYTYIGDGWYYFYGTYTIVHSSSNYGIGFMGDNSPFEVLFSDLQLERKDFVSPFTNTYREWASLEFNLHRDYNLDWSKDWSIIYWKKPMGTHTNNKVGYSIESLGANSNNVGGGYTWWGKENNLNSIASSTPSAINPTTYFDNWRMITVIKSGGIITTKEYSSDGVIHTRTTSPSISVPNYYVNQYGYDLRLGGFDNGNPSCAYYKDLIVLKRKIEDSELDKMLKYHMNVSSGKLNIKDKIYENYKF